MHAPGLLRCGHEPLAKRREKTQRLVPDVLPGPAPEAEAREEGWGAQENLGVGVMFMKAHPLFQLLQSITDHYLNFESPLEIKRRFRIFTLLTKEGGNSRVAPKGAEPWWAETSVCCSW